MDTPPVTVSVPKTLAHPETEAAMIAFSLSLPEATEEFPWGERVLKVKGKIFLFIGQWKGCLQMGMKLPQSRDFALDLPNAEPTRYNLGKSGWVTLRFAPEDELDPPRLRHWILESYRAVAPKRLGKLLDAAGPTA